MFKEIFSMVHGFLGTVFLMAFSGAFAELVELTHHGARRVKIGTALMFATSALLSISGGILYAIYRAPGPASARSKILVGPTPWVHDILMEMKEFTGMYVPVILVVAVYIAWRHSSELDSDKTIRRVLAGILALAMLVTLLTFGLGAYITKVQAL